MTAFKDKTFCASPNCTNKCSRKMTDEETEKLNTLQKMLEYDYVSYSYFCGEPDDE